MIHGCVVRAGCSLWSTFGRNSLRANYRSLEETARRKEVTIMGDMNAREGCETRREEKKNLEKIQRLSTPRAVLMCQMFELNININVCIRVDGPKQQTNKAYKQTKEFSRTCGADVTMASPTKSFT